MIDTQAVRRAAIFRMMTDAEISEALDVLHGEKKRVPKGAVILHAGSTTDRMGVILDGSVTIETNDLWGNRTILSYVGAGEVFAETYAFLPGETMLGDVCTNESCRLLFLRIDGLCRMDAARYPWLHRFVFNLLTISAQKNLALTGRSFHTAPKSARGRLMAYLNTISLQKNSRTFDIPFDRQQLADYLNLERSAVSKELGKMRREGLLEFRKNHFEIRYQPESDPAAKHRYT